MTEPNSPVQPQPRLRAELCRSPGISVLTGGQTGVDTIAARAALKAGLRVHLVLPRGFRQEDGPITAARRRGLRGAVLHELVSPEFRDRTWTCVALADAVILLDPAGGEGCQETIRAAERLGRPLLNLTTAPDPDGPARVGADPAGLDIAGPNLARASAPRAWTSIEPAVSEFISGNRTRVLMIAGCRSSLLAAQHKTGQVLVQANAIAASLRQCQDRLSG